MFIFHISKAVNVYQKGLNTKQTIFMQTETFIVNIKQVTLY